MKIKATNFVARCFELNEAFEESERDRDFFGNIQRTITAKVAYLENCYNRERFTGKSDVIALEKIIRLV